MKLNKAYMLYNVLILTETKRLIYRKFSPFHNITYKAKWLFVGVL